jgi:hypothetical protein
MKKFLIPIISLLLIMFIVIIIAWFNIPKILAHILSKEFSVFVSVGNVDVTKNNLKVKNLNIGTPKGSKTTSSFFAKELNVKSTLKDIRSEKLVIESFSFDNNIIGLEFYNEEGTDNNWNRILKIPTRNKKESNRAYLIKKLTLTNITVILTKLNGQKETFPAIEKLEFYNISDETGFPIDEIEKAIAEAILKSVLQKFNLLKLLDDLSPVKVLKNMIPLF